MSENNHDFNLPLMGQVGDKDDFSIVTESIRVFFSGRQGRGWGFLALF